MPVSPAQPQRVETRSEWEKRIFEERTERLAELEAVIGRGLKSFVEVGQALKEIRDRRLYREQRRHATFEDYCREQWGMSRIHGHRLIRAAEVATDLLPIGNNHLLTCESQARELVLLSTEQRRQVWAEVTNPGTFPPTAKRIRECAEALRHSAVRLPVAKPVEQAEGIKYSLRAVVVVTSDTDPKELEDLIRARQVHWVLRNERDKTLAVVQVETVESLERL